MTAPDREHGTHSCYVHGPDRAFSGRGCRCDPCRAAAAAYEYERSHRVAPTLIDATEAREHVLALRAAGVGTKTIARVSKVPHGSLSKLLYGDAKRGPSVRVRVETAAKLLAVSTDAGQPGSRVPAKKTLAQVAELTRRGWTRADIARAIGQDRALQLGTQYVTRRNASAIAALLDQPVPPRNHGAGKFTVSTWDAETELRAAVHRRAQADRRASYRRVPDDDGPAFDPGPGDLLAAGECRRRTDVPPWLFFVDEDDAPAVAKARAVCESCPVAAECVRWAIDHGEQGIWGGLTESERRDLAGAVA